jgi:hypothetical protein
MHEPALVAALVSENDGNRRRNLLGGNVKTGLVAWEIAVKVPANSYVTELEGSCYPATHIESDLYPLWSSRTTGEISTVLAVHAVVLHASRSVLAVCL